MTDDEIIWINFIPTSFASFDRQTATWANPDR
jgi:hypothetical protein